MKKSKFPVDYKMTRRRVYHYHCLGCSQRRVTVKKRRLHNGYCRICRRNEVDKNQLRIV